MKKLNENKIRDWLQKYHMVTIEESSINMKDYEIQFTARWAAVKDLIIKLHAELSRDNHSDISSKLAVAIDKMTNGANDVTSLLTQAVKDLPQEEPKPEEPNTAPAGTTTQEPQRSEVITGGAQ